MKYNAKQYGDKWVVITKRKGDAAYGGEFDNKADADQFAAVESALYHLREANKCLNKCGDAFDSANDNFNRLWSEANSVKNEVEQAHEKHDGFDPLDPCHWC